MDEFQTTLDNAIKSLMELSKVWNNMDWGSCPEDAFDRIAEKYPFHKDLNELIHDMIDWKESISEK